MAGGVAVAVLGSCLATERQPLGSLATGWPGRVSAKSPGRLSFLTKPFVVSNKKAHLSGSLWGSAWRLALCPG
ncbi:hypothetical protein GCM10011502_05310 [Oceanisphaera marina]|uniref:Uncharacterized protein n=1 Tax=Oceanisphaera marina TaxID=2017550 RepID=A0ABQ1IE36_9GAMM|nr:hypothetical protein GCM10011502_05310 [Oceanisphaera marina]